MSRPSTSPSPGIANRLGLVGYLAAMGAPAGTIWEALWNASQDDGGQRLGLRQQDTHLVQHTPARAPTVEPRTEGAGLRVADASVRSPKETVRV